MLEDIALENLFDRLGTATEARHKIRWIRKNAPIRSVGGGTKNTPCRFSSIKMGFVLEAEAFNTEYAAFEEFENDDLIYEFYSQPCRLRIDYINPNGKPVHPEITPDIFAIGQDSLFFVECKTEADLLQLAQAQPNRFTVDEHGNWRSPPAEIAAQKLGCKFIVRSSKDNNWIALENYEFFCDYLKVPPSELKISPDALRIIEGRLSESSWLTVNDLIFGPEPVDSDSLYGLIVTKKVYFDFQTNRISNPDQALLFRDGVSATAYQTIAYTSVGLKTPSIASFDPSPGRRFEWDGRSWQIVNAGVNGISAIPLNREELPIIELKYEHLHALARNGKIVPFAEGEDPRAKLADKFFRSTTTAQLQTANWRYQILFGTPDQDNPLTKNQSRSIAYWLASYRAAQIEFGIGFVGLIPDRHGTQGNHKQKCDPQAYELAINVYTKYWNTDAQRSATLCHGIYLNVCEEQAVTPLSLRSFGKMIKKHQSHEQTKGRVGEKAAYNEEPPYLVLEYTTPRHGNRPFHIGHIDHTPLPIKTRSNSGKHTLQTIWLTLLIDAFSRYVLAIYLSFDPPSYRSCMMVIRECIRCHGRIPHWIVVDNGPDFQSIYFETLISRLESHKKDRPKGKPKFGSVVERIFQTTIDQFISNLLGATNDMNPRQIGRDVDPSLKAVWTYERLLVRLQEYLSNVYHTNTHSTLGHSPKTALVQGIQTFGERSHSFFSYTQTLIILTCPSTSKGTAKVTAKGVKINYLYYRCTEMDLPGVRGTRLDVRYDPANFGIAYVFINRAWEICYSEYYAIFKDYTEKQIRISTNHLRLKAKLLGLHITINAQNLASFLISAEANEVLDLQRQMDSESSSANTAINTPKEGKVSVANAVSPKLLPTFAAPKLLEDF